MKIEYRIQAPKRANIPAAAKNGADLDRILQNYYQLGGQIADLTIRPVVKLGVVGQPEEVASAE